MSSHKKHELAEHILQVVLNEDGTAKVLGNKDEMQSNATTLADSINLQTFTVIESVDDANSEEGLTTIDYVQSDDQIEHEICELLIVNDSKQKVNKWNKSKCNIDNDLNNLERRKFSVGSTRKRFNKKWLLDPMFANWLEESTVDGHAYCIVCNKVLLPGKSELIKHADTAKHKRNICHSGEALQQGSNNIVNPYARKKVKQEKLAEDFSENVIDFRSECMPKNTYRESLHQYSCGDDTYREDPSVLELERYVAAILHKDSCLFTLNGTLANTICLLTHCMLRYSLVIAGNQSYIYKNSQGALCELGKLSMRHVTNSSDGTFDINELKGILREHNQCWPTSTVVCIENTHTLMGGQPLPMDWLDSLGELCSSYGIPIHMDAVRLGNASVASGITMGNLVRHCSSVALHLDKSFNAIGGCVIAGKKEFINKALRVRKMLGGAFPQAGTFARSALMALQHFTTKISRNHANAVTLAEAISAINSNAVNVDLTSLKTNIITIKCDNITTNPNKLSERLQTIYEEEVDEIGERVILKVLPVEPNIIRLVVHSGIPMDSLRLAIRKLHYVISETLSDNNCYVIEYVT